MPNDDELNAEMDALEERFADELAPALFEFLNDWLLDRAIPKSAAIRTLAGKTLLQAGCAVIGSAVGIDKERSLEIVNCTLADFRELAHQREEHHADDSDELQRPAPADTPRSN